MTTLKCQPSPEVAEEVQGGPEALPEEDKAEEITTTTTTTTEAHPEAEPGAVAGALLCQPPPPPRTVGSTMFPDTRTCPRPRAARSTGRKVPLRLSVTVLLIVHGRTELCLVKT